MYGHGQAIFVGLIVAETIDVADEWLNSLSGREGCGKGQGLKPLFSELLNRSGAGRNGAGDGLVKHA